MPERHRRLEEVSVDDLVRCLQEAGEPLGARRIRGALALDPWCLSAQLTRFLGDAVRTGRVLRTGTGAATRYSAAASREDDGPGVGAGGAVRRAA